MSDPIFALATAPGRAAIAVIRLSGDGVGRALARLAGRSPPPRHASLRRLRDPDTGAVLDQALVLWFPSPDSFTGEDAAELHLHGGVAVVAAVTQALRRLGLRLAEPGEFTRRAFENDRLDLAQAEAVADLVDAETEAQRRQALGQLDGALSLRHAAWRSILLDALAALEAAMDFPDEELPDTLVAAVRAPLRALAEELSVAASDTRGERVREGYRIALIGAPNAGKSSLLNALSGRDLAIVTEIAGTTRDVLEAHLVLEGYAVVLADTAGLRRTDERIEAEGVRRAEAWGAAADLRLLVVDGSAAGEDWRTPGALLRPGDAVLVSKADLPPALDAAAIAWARDLGLEHLVVSALDAGPLRAWLGRRVASKMSGAEAPSATRLRHRDALAAAAERLLAAVEDESAPELMAENIRLAGRSLERIAGRLDPEAVLDRVFSTFCIGK